MQEENKLLGIPSSGYEYMSVLPSKEDIEERLKELFGIRDFLSEIANSKAIPEFQGNKKKDKTI